MEKVVREKLWTHSFCAVAAGNFLLFFAFYLLLPVLFVFTYLFVIACFRFGYGRSKSSAVFLSGLRIKVSPISTAFT